MIKMSHTDQQIECFLLELNAQSNRNRPNYCNLKREQKSSLGDVPLPGQSPGGGRRAQQQGGALARRAPQQRVGKAGQQQHVGRGHSAAGKLTPAGVRCARWLGHPQPGKLPQP